MHLDRYVAFAEVNGTVCSSASCDTTKGGYRRLEKSHKVWMMMTTAASLMWAGAAEKPEQSKMTFKNYQNDLKQLT